ncbi:XapX domain-containing protein [Paenibacillus xanthanilyticus]|uniref:XapX domain-containing protein n=1 Tax=Paenibacillus xanthanilyticus TaxID=1783531 RepID=A0ABV8JWD9_9BACL
MKELVLGLLAGIIVGIVFKLIRLPIPAPPVLSGVIGIVGVYLGGLAGQWIIQHWR